MTEINAAATTQSAVPTAPTTQQQIGEEFFSFIQLLTAQVRNQDPLAPLDSTQFVEQLATFSSLEQQVETNQSLQSIATMISDLNAVFASEWIGQDVAVASDWVPYNGSSVEFSADLPSIADEAVLSVRDTDGNLIWTETLEPGAGSYTWDGRTQSGVPAAADELYEFTVGVFRNDELVGTVTPRFLTTVTDVSTENGQLRLGTEIGLTTDVGSARRIDSTS